MDVNTVSLRVVADRQYVKLHPVNREMITRSLNTGEEYHAHARYLVLSKAEAEFALNCLSGTASFYPWFDDGIHHVKLTSQGIQEAYKNGQKWEDFYFTLPGEWLARVVKAAIAYLESVEALPEDKRPEWSVSYDAEDFAELGQQYGPQVVWDYAPGYCNGNGTGRDVPDVKTILDRDMQDARARGLQPCLDGFVRIAQNYSDGKPVTISLRFDRLPDDNPTSYIFRILTHDGKVIIWGGLIAHRNYKPNTDEHDGTWTYSIHT